MAMRFRVLEVRAPFRLHDDWRPISTNPSRQALMMSGPVSPMLCGCHNSTCYFIPPRQWRWGRGCSRGRTRWWGRGRRSSCWTVRWGSTAKSCWYTRYANVSNVHPILKDPFMEWEKRTSDVKRRGNVPLQCRKYLCDEVSVEGLSIGILYRMWKNCSFAPRENSQ